MPQGNQNAQCRENGNIVHTRRKKTKHNAICIGHHYAQKNTDSVNKVTHLNYFRIKYTCIYCNIDGTTSNEI